MKSVKDLNVDTLVRCVARGLNTINKDKQFDEKLPVEMSARYKVCSAMAKACQV